MTAVLSSRYPARFSYFFMKFGIFHLLWNGFGLLNWLNTIYATKVADLLLICKKKR